MKNYLKEYGTEGVSKFQQGGVAPEAPAPQAAPQGANPEAMLQEWAQNPTPELAMAICEALVGMMGGAQGGAPVPAASNGMRMNDAAPMFKKGGKL